MSDKDLFENLVDFFQVPAFPLVSNRIWHGVLPPSNPSTFTTINTSGYVQLQPTSPFKLELDNPWIDNEFPKMEQWENENKELVIQMILAGYPRETISIEYVENMLEIRADKVDDGRKSAIMAKRSFVKKLTDARGIWDFSKTKSTLKDGILSLVVPRKESKIPIKINIE